MMNSLDNGEDDDEGPAKQIRSAVPAGSSVERQGNDFTMRMERNKLLNSPLACSSKPATRSSQQPLATPIPLHTTPFTATPSTATPSTATPSTATPSTAVLSTATPSTAAPNTPGMHGTAPRSLEELGAGVPALGALLAALAPHRAGISRLPPPSATSTLAAASAAAAAACSLPPAAVEGRVTRVSDPKVQQYYREQMALFEQQQEELRQAVLETRVRVLEVFANPLEAWGEKAHWQLAMCEEAMENDFQGTGKQFGLAFRAKAEEARHATDIPRLVGLYQMDALREALLSDDSFRIVVQRQLDLFKRVYCSLLSGFGHYKSPLRGTARRAATGHLLPLYFQWQRR